MKKEEYICKIASLEEVIAKCDYEIKKHEYSEKWKRFKELKLKNYNENNIIAYVGILENEIICEATAIIQEDGFKEDIENSKGLLGTDMVYLSAFRTNKEYENRGYFSKLFKFIEKDLKSRGYKKISLGVEPCEVRNIQIYFHLGFTNYIKTEIQSVDKEIINFYYKNI